MNNNEFLEKFFHLHSEHFRNAQTQFYNKNFQEDDLDHEDFLKTLQKCLNALPSNWRSVFEAKFIKEAKGKSICKDFEITESNYWQILHRTKLQLRNCLQHLWFSKNKY